MIYLIPRIQQIRISKMELDKVIKNRRTIRNFSKRRVSEEDLKTIIEYGIQAPSYCNTQDWRFILLSDYDKERIVSLGGADIIKNSTIALAVTYKKSVNPYRDDIQSASACIQNMLLKATDLGISSCWVCHLPSKVILKRYLYIPKHYEIIACILFGYPESKTRKVPRKKQDLFLYKGKEVNLMEMLKIVYLRQPIRPKSIEQKFTERF